MRSRKVMPIAPPQPDELAQLGTLPRQELKARWAALYGRPAPRLGRDLLIRSIALRLQEQGHVGLSAAARKQLCRIASAAEQGMPVVAKPPALSPGTRLRRVWRGVTHEVIVMADGFVHRGQTYRSLSVIARTIAGTRWSGPAFFGLRPGKPGRDR